MSQRSLFKHYLGNILFEAIRIRETLQTQNKLERTYQIELIDKEGFTCAVVDKIIHFKKS
jgi:hypothetical protein